MNKNDIYKIIGYQGNYDNKVKKNLRKLLKENHPDIGGNIDNFKIINEVKKELEENKVSYKIKDGDVLNNINDIDYNYCLLRKEELLKEKDKYNRELNIILENLQLNIKKYGILYQESLDKGNNLYDNDHSIDKLMIIICVIITINIILLILFIIKKNYLLLVILGFFLIFLTAILNIFFKKIKVINIKKNVKLDEYFNTINEIKISKNIKKELNNQKLELERKINKINNDIRFYENILKKE